MNVVGLITEYNPFHNGHLYHLETAKRQTNADYCIVIMSGDFTQRGAPAFADKYLRAKMACSCGADLVIELPVYYAAGSAEFFASGAVALLDRLGVVNSLCFGSECGDLGSLKAAARLLIKEPPKYKEYLKTALKSGLSFPAARQNAFHSYMGGSENPQIPELASILIQPNNILGIEYLKALFKRKSAILPVTIPRKSAAYHETRLRKSISSATAIRELLENSTDLTHFKDQIPMPALDLLFKHQDQCFPVLENDFSLMLKYRLLIQNQPSLSNYQDVPSDLGKRIQNKLSEYQDISSFTKLLKTRQITYNTVRRALTHILLDLKAEDLKSFVRQDFVFYARVLGFRREAFPLLKEIKNRGTIPLLTRLSGAPGCLDHSGLKMLSHDILAADIYESVVADKFKTPPKNEYTRQILPS